jgi:serine/threonine protein kinase
VLALMSGRVTARPPDLTTTLQGRYRLDRKLGQGGMATVHLAEDLKHYRKVAVKLLRPEPAAKPTGGSASALKVVSSHAGFGRSSVEQWTDKKLCGMPENGRPRPRRAPPAWLGCESWN